MEGRTGHGRAKGKKTDKTRRTWVKPEEDVLMLALKDLVQRGFKGDNGFRTGYLNRLHNAIKAKFPSTDITIQPHITSKISSWRKSYASLVTAHGVTGVGFNTTTNQLDVTYNQWKAVVERDSSMHGLRYKEWPLFPDWIEVFGKDRATGENAEDMKETEDELPNTDTLGGEQGESGYAADYVNMEKQTNNINENNQFEQDQEGTSTANNSKQHSGSSSKKRKARSDATDPALVELLREVGRNTAERLDKLANRIGYEHDLSNARKQVYEIIGKIPGLSVSEKFDVADALAAKPEQLDIFMSLPENDQPLYVQHLLDRLGA